MRFLLRPFTLLSATALVFAGFLWMWGFVFRPAQTPPVPRTTEEVALLEQRRAMTLQRENPPVVVQAVDYAEGPAAPWWPKVDPPVIADHVAAGRLPSVAERTGPEPLVLAGVDGVHHYGGSWYRLIASRADLIQIYNRMSYANLLRWSPQGYPVVPHLAKSWEVSDDQRVFTFQLRRGMRWSDGHPVTSADLDYWYQHEVRHFRANPRVLRNGTGLGRVEVVDELTFRFVFDEPNPLFIELSRGLQQYQTTWGRLPQISIPSGGVLKRGSTGKRVNALRARGCSGANGTAERLKQTRALDTVAKEWAKGTAPF